MRKVARKEQNSEVANFEDDVPRRLSALEKRVSRLETVTVGTWFDPQEPSPVRRGKGRRPRIEPVEVLKRRDQLVAWLERAWPHVSIALRKARNSRDATAAIVGLKEHMAFVGPLPPFARNPENHRVASWQFLQSGRFHENPRNLAAAMAGLPEVTWKRSFDICSGHPCKLPVAQEAIRDYLRRKFPDRLRELREAKTAGDVRMILKKSRSHDPTYANLKKYPEQVLELLNPGKPFTN